MRILLASNEEDNKVLHAMSRELSVEEILSDKVQNLAAEMKSYVMSDKKCKGLAAPQVGHNIRLFVIKHGKSSRTYINPTFLWRSRVTNSIEKCLSCGDISKVRERFAKMNVEYVDETGKLHVIVLKDFNAFAYQHELDHLNGKLIID